MARLDVSSTPCDISWDCTHLEAYLDQNVQDGLVLYLVTQQGQVEGWAQPGHWNICVSPHSLKTFPIPCSPLHLVTSHSLLSWVPGLHIWSPRIPQNTKMKAVRPQHSLTLNCHDATSTLFYWLKQVTKPSQIQDECRGQGVGVEALYMFINSRRHGSIETILENRYHLRSIENGHPYQELDPIEHDLAPLSSFFIEQKIRESI